MLSEALDKDTVLKVTMQIPPTLLSPIVRVSLVCYYITSAFKKLKIFN